LGESIAGIILFREGDKPFTSDDAATVRAIAPVFAIALATMVRGEIDPNDAGLADDYDGPLLDEGDDSSGRRKKKDDSDWWKRGEPPPF
jgi:hypothetical protein